MSDLWTSRHGMMHLECPSR